MPFYCSSIHSVYCKALRLFVRLRWIINANSIAGKFILNAICENSAIVFIKATITEKNMSPFNHFFQGETADNLLNSVVKAASGKRNMFWWSYCSCEEMLRLVQLFLTRTVLHIICRVKHQGDHLTGSISNTKHLAENPKHLTSILCGTLCGTAEGGEHLFLHLLLQTGRGSRDITEVQHNWVVNLIQC